MSEIPMIPVTGGVLIDGDVIDGIQKLNLDDSYLVDSKVLSELIDKSRKFDALKRDYDVLKNSSDSLVRVVKAEGVRNSGAIALETELNKVRTENEALWTEIQNLLAELKTAKAENQSLREAQNADLTKKLCQKSIEVRHEKSLKATAIALSMAIQGAWTGKIADALEERGFASSGTSISRLLATKSEDDRDRLRSVMLSYPEEFEGLSVQDFTDWFAKRYQKKKESEKRRRVQKAVEEAMANDDWDEYD